MKNSRAQIKKWHKLASGAKAKRCKKKVNKARAGHRMWFLFHIEVFCVIM
jgi:hypothetical protein